jgi:O-antigen chain-terminating methyltransferase
VKLVPDGLEEALKSLRGRAATDRLVDGTRFGTAKGLLLRLLRVYTRHQTDFNRELVESLERLQGVASRLDVRLDELERAHPKLSISDAQYRRFEDRFRGDISGRLTLYPKLVQDALAETRGGLVLDLGCGRGELLAALKANGIEAAGVDSSTAMVGACRAQELTAECLDLRAALDQRPDGSLGAVLSLHVVEHLEVAAVADLVQLVARKLRPGGLLALETPNVRTLAGAADFYLDPTHRRPVHPELLDFLIDIAGFRRREVRYLAPCEPGSRLQPFDEAAGPWAKTANQNLERLNALLFGCRDYVALGWR